VAADPARLEPLRARAREHLARTAGALRIRLDNPSEEPVTGLLLGAVLEPTRLKSARLPHGGLTWERPRGIPLRADGGEAYDLLLEGPGPGRLTVVLEPDFRHAVDLTELADPWRATRRDGRWESTNPRDGERLATLTVEWTEAGGGVAVDPAAANAELRRQLAALGYVD
jgi:hypothetical protein